MDIASGWHQSGCNSLANCKNTNLQIHKHKLVLGRHTLAARKPLSSYNDNPSTESSFGVSLSATLFPHFPKTPLTLAIYSLSGYLMGATYPRHPLPCPPSKSPQCPVSRGWIEAASSLTKLVKGVSHQLGLWHICLSTPESPETTVVTRHVSSHLTLSFSLKYQTKPLWSFRQLHGNINICVHRQRARLSPVSLPILSPLLHQSRYFLPSPDECY